MSFGNKSTSKTEIPAWVEDGSKQAVDMASARNELGYIPYYGPDVAAFNPMQMQAMQGSNTMARSLGLPEQGLTLMTPTDYGNGVWGHSSQPLYQDNMDRLEAANPELFAALRGLTGDPSQRSRQGGNGKILVSPEELSMMKAMGPAGDQHYSQYTTDPAEAGNPAGGPRPYSGGYPGKRRGNGYYGDYGNYGGGFAGDGMGPSMGRDGQMGGGDFLGGLNDFMGGFSDTVGDVRGGIGDMLGDIFGGGKKR